MHSMSSPGEIQASVMLHSDTTILSNVRGPMIPSCLERTSRGRNLEFSLQLVIDIFIFIHFLWSLLESSSISMVFLRLCMSKFRSVLSCAWEFKESFLRNILISFDNFMHFTFGKFETFLLISLIIDSNISEKFCFKNIFMQFTVLYIIIEYFILLRMTWINFNIYRFISTKYVTLILRSMRNFLRNLT